MYQVEDASCKNKPTYLHKCITTEKKDKRIYANALKIYHTPQKRKHYHSFLYKGLHYCNKWNKKNFSSRSTCFSQWTALCHAANFKVTPPHWDGWMLLTAFLVITLRKKHSYHLVGTGQMLVGNLPKKISSPKTPLALLAQSNLKEEVAIILFTKVWEG